MLQYQVSISDRFCWWNSASCVYPDILASFAASTPKVQ